MSYILDAIKKADKKRKLGEVPDVSTIHEAPATEPRRFGWLYGVAALLFVNAGGLAWWLWVATPAQEAAVQTLEIPAAPGQQPPPSSSPPTAAVQPPPAAPAVATLPPSAPPAQPVSSPPPQAGAPPATVQPKAVQAGEAGNAAASAKTAHQPAALPAKDAPAADPATLVPVQEAASSLPVPAEEARAEDAAASEEEALAADDESLPAEEPVEEAAAEEQTLVPIASSRGAKERAQKKTEKEDEDPELAKIPFLKQLPAEIQKSLPVLHVSFHSYSHTPSARLVSISGKILRQGQEFDENLKVERITVKGVVLDFKGKRFRIDV